MSIIIRPATEADLAVLAAKMRPEDRREISAVAPYDAGTIAAILAQSSPDFRFVAILRGEPVAALGVARSLPGLGSAWAFGNRRMRRALPALTRFARDTIAPNLIRAGFRRIEVRSAVDHDISHRWLESLGFVAEGVAVDYGADGLDFITYAATSRNLHHVLRLHAQAAAGAAAAEPAG